MGGNVTVFIAGVIVILLSLFSFSGNCLQKLSDWLLFSKYAPVLTLGVGGTCFLINVLHLSAADFGEYRLAFIVIFGMIILLSFFKMRELLAIRGLAVLLLVCSKAMLDNIYCEPILWKNYFVSFVYLIIIFSMLIGSMPYLFRDFLDFLIRSKPSRIILGICSMAYGTLLVFISLATIGRNSFR
ncbi:MAG: hypothetical protein LBQ23_04145 [Puniceicoccales bacterium]|jgi:hypothetical protein|nr:hypothetical protein [Puniceicoccales bacterium]